MSDVFGSLRRTSDLFGVPLRPSRSSRGLSETLVDNVGLRRLSEGLSKVVAGMRELSEASGDVRGDRMRGTPRGEKGRGVDF